MKPRRTYRACVACRLRKVRCDVGDSNNPDPPCARCRRMDLKCEPVGRGRGGGTVHVTRKSPAPGGGHQPRGHDHRSAYTSSYDEPTGDPRPRDVEPLSLIDEAVHDSTDALNALIRAAASPEAKRRGVQLRSDSSPGSSFTSRMQETQDRAEDVNEDNDHPASSLRLPTPRPSLSTASRMWQKCWLVRTRWLKPDEAAWYIDEFFRTTAPMTPIVSDFFRDPKTHELLVVYEPILCYTILTISTMFHRLPTHSISPGRELLHSKCWGIVKRLCERVLWADEHGSASRLRTFGTVLALLLLVEWPPDAINLPPDDVAEIIGSEANPPTLINRPKNLEDSERHIRMANATQWMADLTQPIIRSDRMSGMLLGMAHSLSNELDILHSSSPDPALCSDKNEQMSPTKERYISRRARVRLLLHVYTSLSSITLRAPYPFKYSMLASDLAMLGERATLTFASEKLWLQAVVAWGQLSKLAHDARLALFQTPQQTKDLLRSMKHVQLLNHHIPLLREWHQETKKLGLSSPAATILRIEYHLLHVQLASLAVQSLSNHLMEQTGIRLGGHTSIQEYLSKVEMFRQMAPETDEDYRLARDALSGSQSLLESVLDLGNQDRLQMAPFRVFTRVVFAATLLVKASPHKRPRTTEVTASLAAVESVKEMLSTCFANRAHPAHNTATLLSLHISQLRSLLTATQTEDPPSTLSDYDHAMAEAGGNLTFEHGGDPNAGITDGASYPSTTRLTPNAFEIGTNGEGFDGEGDLPALFQDDWFSSDFDSMGFGFMTGNGMAADSLEETFNLGDEETGYWRWL